MQNLETKKCQIGLYELVSYHRVDHLAPPDRSCVQVRFLLHSTLNGDSAYISTYVEEAAISDLLCAAPSWLPSHQNTADAARVQSEQRTCRHSQYTNLPHPPSVCLL